MTDVFKEYMSSHYWLKNGEYMSESNAIEEFLSFIHTELGEDTWVILYKKLDKEDKSSDGSLFSCLAPIKHTAKAMEGNGWDLCFGQGGPSIVTSGKDEIWYEANSSDYFPLVYRRSFHGVRESYNEISQELVLFLNLYHDEKNKKYLVDDDDGNEVSVIKYSDIEITIRKHFLKAFMAAKQMNLLLFFENTLHFKNKEIQADENIQEESLKYTKFSGKSYIEGYKSFIRCLGKKLVYCLPRTESNCEAMPANDQYESFIISGDEFDKQSHTCDPNTLADYFGKNPSAPHYLTPVFFSKSVMQKYYSASSDYEVGDSTIIKSGYWHLRFDNNSIDYVCVFLGDLGQDLPYSEQVYWKSFNIHPESKSMSDTYFRRSILGQFSEAKSPDLVFKRSFERFNKEWLKYYDWPLFKPLNSKDKHCFSSLHSLSKNEQSEFDAQVINLVKCTNDSINVKELKKLVFLEEPKSIKLIAGYLTGQGVTFDVGGFLGGLQGIRSTGVAHRRSSDYDKTTSRLGIGDDLIAAFDNILTQMTAMLANIEQHLMSSKS